MELEVIGDDIYVRDAPKTTESEVIVRLNDGTEAEVLRRAGYHDVYTAPSFRGFDVIRGAVDWLKSGDNSGTVDDALADVVASPHSFRGRPAT